MGKERELMLRGESIIPVYINSSRRKPFPSGKYYSFSQLMFAEHQPGIVPGGGDGADPGPALVKK